MWALQSLDVLWQEANKANLQLNPVVEALSLKLGKCIEKTVHKEMDKLSDIIKSTITDQCNLISPTDSIDDTVSTLRK